MKIGNTKKSFPFFPLLIIIQIISIGFLIYYSDMKEKGNMDVDVTILAALIGAGVTILVALIGGMFSLFRQGKSIEAIQDASGDITDIVKTNGIKVDHVKQDVRDFRDLLLPEIKGLTAFVVESRALRNSTEAGGINIAQILGSIQAMAEKSASLQEQLKELRSENQRLLIENERLRNEQELWKQEAKYMRSEWYNTNISMSHPGKRMSQNAKL